MTGEFSHLKYRDLLVVDDDPVIRELLQRRLTQVGFEVRAVADASQACWEILSRTPDCVISDWQMPHMDGVALCHWLRGRDLGQYVFFLLVTAHDKYFDAALGEQSGADDYLQKPFDFDELVERLLRGFQILDEQNGEPAGSFLLGSSDPNPHQAPKG